MKKIYLVTIALMAIFLAGCNMPVTQDTPPVNLVETAVANTLTSQSIVITPLQTETAPPAPTHTAIPGISETPTPQPPEVNTPTPTLLPESPRPDLGDPSSTYNFNDGVALGLQETYDDGQTRFYVSNGKLFLTSLNVNGYRGWRLTSARPDDFYLESEFQTQQCAGKDQYGLVFRAKDYDSGQGYYLAISCDGQYKLTKWTDSGIATVKDWTISDFINDGSNQLNRIGIYAQDQNITIYANDQKVDELSDGSLTSDGYIGFFVAGKEIYGFTVEVDFLSYWDR